jgi:UDP-N-acetylglucosamine 2-epimerase (non-hydrolysing)
MESKKNVWVVFGTRPEAIKMCPLVNELKKDDSINVSVCVTAQHREMLDQVLDVFDIQPDHDLDVMTQGQTLSQLTARIVTGMDALFSEKKPDLVLVHGDTTTTFAVATTCFLHQIEVGHVEAGLRTYDLGSPWPEEGNRQLTKVLTRWNFAPTDTAKENLLSERTPQENVFVTGNTVIDALLWVKERNSEDELFLDKMRKSFPFTSQENEDRRMILVTGHRRENHGQGFENICAALKELSLKFPDSDIVYPVHLNPNVRGPVEKYLSGIDNIHLIAPQEYRPFVYLMEQSHIILTDSGGIQEEAPSLGKPVLVMRDTTERPEAVNAGTVKLVGTNCDMIVSTVSELMESDLAYKEMSRANNPYGDGKACERIVKIIKSGSL